MCVCMHVYGVFALYFHPSQRHHWRLTRCVARLPQVDASTFTADFATRQALAARPDLGDGGNLRPVVDLLVRGRCWCECGG